MKGKQSINDYLILIYLFIVIDKVSSVNLYHYGVLATESSYEKENFCIIFFPQFSPLPDEKSKADFHIVQDESTLDLCIKNPERDFKTKIILLNQSNCSLAKQARVVQEQGGIGAVFISSGPKEDQNAENSTEGVNITVALISKGSVQRLREMKEPISGKLFAPLGFSFDYSLLIIWVVAMLTVCIGGYWSGLVRYKLHCKGTNKISELDRDNRGIVSNTTKCTKRSMQEESSLNISSSAVGVFVLCMCVTLLLLYFFFDYLVYFLIGVFVIVSINSVYVCLYPLVTKVFPRCFTLLECHVFDEIKVFDFRHLLLFTISVATSTTWVVIRKEKYSWILQDILGVLFCINMLKNIRLPNLKICTLLLSLLFFYDIFFVFITPFLTAKGGSVMEEVATGGTSEEKLPMVLRVPHFNFNPLAVCYQQFSLLGFGDILIPGLLISYCHGFDLITSNCRKYFTLVSVTYGIGLILTFVGVNLMGTAQPALLYLVPATLIPPILLGWYQGELSLLWNGLKNQIDKETEIVAIPPPASDLSNSANVEIAVPSQNVSATASCTNVCTRKNAREITNDSVNERKHLLR